MIIVAHVNVVNPASREVETLRLCSSNSYQFDGHDYMPFLSKAASYSQTLFSRGTTSGEVSVGSGDLEVEHDGSLHYLRTYGFDGQTVELYILQDVLEELTTSNLYFRATALSPEHAIRKITIKLSDGLKKLDVVCSEATFLGDNQGPVGLEGSDETIKGNLKPMLYGRCFNIPLFCLNTSTLIYGCNYDKDGERNAVKSIWNVRDKGGEILWEGDVATSTALLAASVTDAYYKTCLAEGLIKLGSIPVGDVTADIYESDGEDSSAPNVVRRVLEDIKGYSSGQDFNPAELTALHAKNSCPVGIYITSDLKVLDVCAQLLDSIGAWMIPDSEGVLRFGRIEDPSDFESVETITDDNFTENTLTRQNTNDEGKNIPAWKIELRHTKNWKVLPRTSVLESLDLELKETLEKEYRSDVAEDADIKIVHPLATFPIFDTLLMMPRPAKLRDGNFDNNTDGHFSLSQVSGSGGSATFNGQLTLVPGTGVYSATQTLSTPDEIYHGNYEVRLTLVSGTIEVSIAGATPVAYTTAGELRIPFSYTSGSSVTVALRANNAYGGAGTAVVDTLRVYEVNPGLSPEEEAERRFEINKKTHERYVMELDFNDYRHLFPGTAITLQTPELDFGDGVKFLIIGRDDDLDEESIDLDIWRINEY